MTTYLNGVGMEFFNGYKEKKRSLPYLSTSNSKTMDQEAGPAKKAKIDSSTLKVTLKMGSHILSQKSVEKSLVKPSMMPSFNAENKRTSTTTACPKESDLRNDSSQAMSIADQVKLRKRRNSCSQDLSALFNEPEISLPQRKRRKKSPKYKSKDQLYKSHYYNEPAGLINKELDCPTQNCQGVGIKLSNNCLDIKPIEYFSCKIASAIISQLSPEDINERIQGMCDSIDRISKEDYHNHIESVNLFFVKTPMETNSNESEFRREVASALESKAEFDKQRKIQSIETTFKNCGLLGSSVPNLQKPLENDGDFLDIANKVVQSYMEKDSYIEPAVPQEYCPNDPNLIPTTRTDVYLYDLASTCTKIIPENTSDISKPDTASPMTDSTAEKDPSKSGCNAISEITIKAAEIEFKESKELDSNAFFACSESLKYPIEMNESPKPLDPFGTPINDFYGIEVTVESDYSFVSPKPEKPSVGENTWVKEKTRSAKEIVESDMGLVSPKPEKPSVGENTLLKEKTRSAKEIVESDMGLVSPKPEKPSVGENTLLKEKTRSAKEIEESDIGLVSPKPEKPSVGENTWVKEKTRSEKIEPVVPSNTDSKTPQLFRVMLDGNVLKLLPVVYPQSILNICNPPPVGTFNMPTGTPAKKTMPLTNQNSISVMTMLSKDKTATLNASKEGELKCLSENLKKNLGNRKKTTLEFRLPETKAKPLNEKHLNRASLPSCPTEKEVFLNTLEISKNKYLPSPQLKDSAQSTGDQENSKKGTLGFSLPDIKAKPLNEKRVNITSSPSCSNPSRPILTKLEPANDKGLQNPKPHSLPNRNANVVRVQNDTKSNGSKQSSSNGNILVLSTPLNTEIKRNYVTPKITTGSLNTGKVTIPGSRLQSLCKQGPLKLSPALPRNNYGQKNTPKKVSDLPIIHTSPSMDHKHRNSASTSKDDPMLDRARIVFAGNLPPDYDENCLRKRFRVFGVIEKIDIKKSKDKEYDSKDMNLHTSEKKEEKKRFAFITFKTREAADRAIKNGNSYCGPILHLRYGLMRQYVGGDYTDLDAKVAENEEIQYNFHASSIKPPRNEDDYSRLLAQEQLKRGLISK